MSLNQLQRARALDLPSREAMLQRAPSVQQFWMDNQLLLSDAWAQWEHSEKDHLVALDDSLLDANLRQTVAQAWQNPTKESAVQELWQELAPDVFECQFFDPERLADLRDYLDKVSMANIPMRPPYGIALNRGGAMLDRRSEGFLAAPGFQVFYRELLDRYMRPIARLLFPEVTGYDTQTFGFSIQYQASKDTSLRLHTDASAVTLNINLNKPGEVFTGSVVDFYNSATGQVKAFTFKPGTAVIHRGSVAHKAHPISSGERTNFVLWLYGERGQIPPHSTPRKLIEPAQRWTIPPVIADDFAPF
ncbi:2OG-Fe(II) oxygenase [Marinagarivorans algicola]|uniref:2OG-Fe(II) oxygenase n=1 Tax=Marinagarivorans algicola TaxID=1513270 RepID=UPI0006B5F797|nr:2OG-Fe(II) oxygenase [Marinagarivorans algicola]